MNDLFNTPDPAEADLRTQLEAKWKEKTPEELLNAKIESDLYIKTLERQKDELRTDYMRAQEEIQRSKALEELVDRLNKEKNTPADTTPKPIENTPAKMDPAELEKFFESKYDQKKLLEKETQNYNEVQQKLRERFGNNAGDILTEQANTLGLSKEDVNALAKKSPEAFFRIMGLNNQGKDNFMAPPRSDMRTDNYAPRSQKRTWNYYQDLKKKNPNEYWSPKTQLQMHKDSEALGSAFEDGDFNS